MSSRFRCSKGHQWEIGEQSPTSPNHLICPECGASAELETAFFQQEDASGTEAPFDPWATRDDRRVPDTGISRSFPEIPGYEILSELGRGGMGVVYKARQLALDRLVALKMILSSAHAGPELLMRFRSEAEAFASLQHPNLVGIYEIGEHDGTPFFSLEYVDGGTLADLLKREQLSLEEAAQLIETVAQAIHYAHQRRIIHRDLKPSNILVTSDGVPKVSDFGLAKRLDDDNQQTRTGAVLGTPAYMAPEQAAGRTEDIGTPVDIYALGAVLYEVLTSRPPFLGDSEWSTINMVINEEPRPPSQFRKVPRDLETICLKCLEKNPNKRYASAQALAEDLRRFRLNEPILARPARPRERFVKFVRRRPAIASLIGVSILAFFALIVSASYYHLNIQRMSDDNLNRAIRLCVETGTARLANNDAFSALLWYAEALMLENEPPRKKLHRMRYAALLRQSPKLAYVWNHGSVVRHGSFSPDGRWVVTASDDKTARIWHLSEKPKEIPPLEHKDRVLQAWFSADGERVLTACADGTARVWDARTGSPITEPLKHGDSVVSAAFDPQGERVLTTGGNDRAVVWNAFTGEKIGAIRYRAEITCARFSPDGRFIVTASSDGSARIWRADNFEPYSAPLQHAGPVRYAAFSPNGEQVVTASDDSTARIWTVAESQKAQMISLLAHAAPVKRATYSHDGSMLVTIADNDTASLWSLKSEASLISLLKHDSSVSLYPSFSPDDSFVVTSSDDNTARVWSTVTGQLATSKLLQNGTVQSTSLTRDGRFLLTTSDDGSAIVWDLAVGTLLVESSKRSYQHLSPRSIYDLESSRIESVRLRPRPGVNVQPVSAGIQVKHPTTGKVLMLADRGANFAVFSDDGKWVVTGNREFARVWNAETGAPRSPPLEHASEVTNADFSPDNRLLVTCSNETVAKIWNIDTGTMATAPLKHQGTVWDADFSPDGSLIVTASEDETVRIWSAFSGQIVTPPLHHPRPVVEVTFQNDRQVRTVMEDGTEQIWKLPTCDYPDETLRGFAQILSGSRIVPQGALPLNKRAFRQLWESNHPRYPEFFRTTPEEILNWRERIANEAWSAGRWDAVIWQTDVLLKERRDDWHYLMVRGDAEAESERWLKSAADFVRVLDRHPDNLEAMCRLALVKLHLGETAEFSRICHDMLKRIRSEKDVPSVFAVLLTCSTSTSQRIDRQDTLETARDRWSQQKTSLPLLRCYAYSLYRNGEVAESLERLEELHRGCGDMVSAETLFYLALACQRLGKNELAASYREQALERYNLLKTRGTTHKRANWMQRIRLDRLRREADQMFGDGEH
ncbi:MAG: hypothetical protein KatS3mg105_0500 [Gemmatales bacterium]|nr:MAG: hypothetical protein KatS3mg105_0500 [Gemmatales bacterium]